jgi:hypothetical protein
VRIILGSLPFLATVLWSLVFYYRTASDKRSFRWSLALGCVSLGTFTLTLSEGLSVTHLLQRRPVLLTWAAVCVIPVLLLWLRRESIDPASEIVRLRKKLSSLPLWIVFAIAFTSLLIIVMAAVTPPMNFDVQIYHLPRQIFWMMQGSVEPFPATHTHQISMPVLAEYIGLNLLFLSGTDTWHNLVQTLFMAASCGLISLMVGDLGGSPRAQGLAVLSALLVPAAFFEASNPKNDLILALFALFPLWAGLRLWSGHSKPDLSLLLTAALSAGLAIATKGTAVVYLIPSAILIFIACLRQRAGRILLMAILPGLLLVILPPLPQMLRNEVLFHSPAGPNLHHGNLSHHASDVLNVAIRNIAGQFTCNSASWNGHLESATRSFLGFLGLDPDDPATTFEGQKFHLPYFAGLEDIVPAPVQTALLIFVPLFLFIPCLRSKTGVVPLLLCSYGALLLFCFLFRWQPWQSRLLIPGYFMAMPLIGIMLDHLRPAWLPFMIMATAAATLRPHLLYAGQRPLFGGSSIFRMSSEDQMSRMMPGRALEIVELVSVLGKTPPSVIQIDGGATEIYGLLRALRTGLPGTILWSSPADHPADGSPWIIESTTKDAGVTPPPREPSPAVPSGYRVYWSGDYYRVFVPTR